MRTSNHVSNGIHYEQNGAGRDSYIYNNNGGNTYSEPRFEFPGSRLVGGAHAYRKGPGYAAIGAAPYHYHQNGTGRDGYIAVDHGGMLSPTPKQMGFATQLRGYNRSENRYFGRPPP